MCPLYNPNICVYIYIYIYIYMYMYIFLFIYPEYTRKPNIHPNCNRNPTYGLKEAHEGTRNEGQNQDPGSKVHAFSKE